MQRKGSTSVSDVEEIGLAIRKTKTLDSEEEKVLRMRHGAKASPDLRLERHKVANVSADEKLQDELLLMEMELLRAWRLHQSQSATKATPVQSRTKDKIVRALRKKH